MGQNVPAMNAPRSRTRTPSSGSGGRGELVSPLAAQLSKRGVPFLLTSAYEHDELPRALQSAAQLRKPYSDLDLLDGLTALMLSAERNN